MSKQKLEQYTNKREKGVYSIHSLFEIISSLQFDAYEDRIHECDHYALYIVYCGKVTDNRLMSSFSCSHVPVTKQCTGTVYVLEEICVLFKYKNLRNIVLKNYMVYC